VIDSASVFKPFAYGRIKPGQGQISGVPKPGQLIQPYTALVDSIREFVLPFAARCQCCEVL